MTARRHRRGSCSVLGFNGFSLVACSLGALMLCLGCRTAEEPPRETNGVDLAALLPEAKILTESSRFTVGAPPAEPTLVSGWSFPERNAGDDRRYRWGLRPASELAFTVVAPRDLTVRLEGLPAPDSRAPRRFEARWNGTRVGAFAVRPGWSQYTVPIPRQAQTRGVNRMTILYDPGGSQDRRAQVGKRPNLAMAWSRIAIDGLESPEDGPATGRESALYLPLGSQVEFLMRPGPEARLEVEHARRIGDRAGTIEVYQRSDESEETHLGSVLPGEGVAFALAESGVPIRLALVAVPASNAGESDAVVKGASRGPGIVLQAPAVVSSRRAEEAPRTSTAPQPEPRPNIIVYLVDTLRSDRLGCYGHTKDVSPRLDRFAARANLFENSRAQSSWTLASAASIFTGVWPPAHGVVHPSNSLNPEALTLAERLQEAGYWTSAIVTNEFVTDKFGLAQGFQEHQTMARNRLSSADVLTESIRWLEGRPREQPFFLYLHTVDPHQPYLPDEEFRQRFAPNADEMFELIRAEPERNKWEPTESSRRQLLALYDALVAQNDHAFGQTLDYLEREGLFEDALIVFLSDHGEEFYEHRAWTHGANLFAETINVPLVIKLPGQTAGKRIDRVAQHIDLLPTLLDYLRLDRSGLPGRSLLGDIEAPNQELEAPPVWSHTFRNKKENYSVIDGAWKYMIRDVPGDSWQLLVNWRDDPRELGNLTESHPIRSEFLEALIQAELNKKGLAAAGEAVLDEETRNSLRALGYLQ